MMWCLQRGADDLVLVSGLETEAFDLGGGERGQLALLARASFQNLRIVSPKGRKHDAAEATASPDERQRRRFPSFQNGGSLSAV